jgi:PGF-pre-PGF domain-containing protein
MNKIGALAIIFTTLFFITISPVAAQYDSGNGTPTSPYDSDNGSPSSPYDGDVVNPGDGYSGEIIEPRYEDGSEVFGIDIESGRRVSIYPEGCGFVERITFDFNDDVDGEIRINSFGEETPIEEKEIEKVVEYCEIELSNIDSEKIESMNMDTRVRKSWLRSEGVEEQDIALYSYGDDDSDWTSERTQKESDNSIYVFYNSEVDYSQYVAIGEYKGDGLFGFNPWMILICCVLIIILLLILSAIYYIMNRRRNKGGIQQQPQTYNTYGQANPYQ